MSFTFHLHTLSLSLWFNGTYLVGMFSILVAIPFIPLRFLQYFSSIFHSYVLFCCLFRPRVNSYMQICTKSFEDSNRTWLYLLVSTFLWYILYTHLVLLAHSNCNGYAISLKHQIHTRKCHDKSVNDSTGDYSFYVHVILIERWRWWVSPIQNVYTTQTV